MTILTNTFDAGTNGADVTVANSADSGNPFTNVYAGITYSNAQASHGGISAAIASGSTATMMFWEFTGDTSVALRYYLYVDSHNGAGRGLIHFRQTTPTNALACSLQLATNNRLRVQDKVNGALWTAGADFPIDQWVRLEVLIEQGTGTGDGQIRAAYYLGDSTTPEQDSGTLASANLGGDLGPIHEIRVGRPFGTMADTLYVDSFAARSGADVNGLIGPIATTPPPAAPEDYRWGYDGSAWVPMTQHDPVGA